MSSIKTEKTTNNDEAVIDVQENTQSLTGDLILNDKKNNSQIPALEVRCIL